MSNDYKDLTDRLRGHYRVPITDGLGATGGGEEPDNPNEFVRNFPTVPIQLEAANMIEALRTRIKELEDENEQLIVEAIEALKEKG